MNICSYILHVINIIKVYISMILHNYFVEVPADIDLKAGEEEGAGPISCVQKKTKITQFC